MMTTVLEKKIAPWVTLLPANEYKSSLTAKVMHKYYKKLHWVLKESSI